jgi:hypothetical protein
LRQEEKRASPSNDGKNRRSWRERRDFSVSFAQGRFHGRQFALSHFPLDAPDFTRLIHAAKPLFAWPELEDVPQLLSIKEILGSLPDEALLDGLRAARGNGRDDYPVTVLWGVVLLSILCRHTHFEDCLDELLRNPTLCVLIGINSPTGIPNSWNVSRFLDVLGQEPHLHNSRAIRGQAGVWGSGGDVTRGRRDRRPVMSSGSARGE